MELFLCLCLHLFANLCSGEADRCHDSVLPGYRNKAGVAFNDQMSARFIGQEIAVEAAKELRDIWQEAKQHIVFEFEEDETRLPLA